MKLSALHPQLRQHGLAVSSLGSISDQTLAGCLSTATHGSGVTFGNLSSCVEFLDIVLPLPDAPVVRVSRTQDPDLFLSATCGLGVVGVIVGVSSRCEKVFNLEEECWSIGFEEFVERWQEIAESAEHVRCWWFPQVGQVKVSRLNRTQKVYLVFFDSLGALADPFSLILAHLGAPILALDLLHRDYPRQTPPRRRPHRRSHFP
jgi:L-gulonolactone oxidase